MMPWLINFKDKTVVIVGGGAVASRKALQFLKEGAKVKIMLLALIEARGFRGRKVSDRLSA